MTRNRTRRVFLLAAAIGLPALLLCAYLVLAADLPAPDTLIHRSSPDATKIFDRQGRLLYEILDPRAGRRTRLPIEEMPSSLQEAVLAVEDANFYEHAGVDVQGVARAFAQAIPEGRFVSGGSTITQQLARELMLSQAERDSRSALRKMREMVLAVRISQTYPKRTILQMYLNEVYFGQLAYGVEAAAQTFFGKPARELDLAEAALLAGLIQAPATYNPLVNLEPARERQAVVLGLMVKHGFISQAASELARSEPLHFSPEMGKGRGQLLAPHFVTYVRNLLEQEFGPERVNRGGLQIVTTLDLDLQGRAEGIIRQRLQDLAERTRRGEAPDTNVHDAALVALDARTGEILAMVGSADYEDERIDGAVNVALANRQPGSAIKPITFAAAFGRDYTPATVLVDVPTNFLTKENEPYAPQNYDLAWHGPISLRRALATSSNLVAVKVLDHVGIPSMVQTAQALGISTFQDPERFGLALTLGGGEVKLLELTAAYAAFANQGRRVEPTAILQIYEAGPGIGEAVRESVVAQWHPREGTQSVSPQVAYLVTDILSDDLARVPAFGEDSVLKLSRPAAAKTGTTSDFRDNWTIGYTPDLAVGVWAGNANNDPMYKVTGITGAAPIWHDFMEQAEAGKPVTDFTRPEGLLRLEVCEPSGLLPTPECPRVRTEVFIQGSEPTRADDSYRRLAVDASSGQLWSDGCRGPMRTVLYHILPPEAQEWGLNQGLAAPPTRNCAGEDKAQTRPDCQGGAAACLVISMPPRNSTFAASPQLPLESQKVEIAARPGGGTGVASIALVLDGQVLAKLTSPPYRVLWQLAPGAHTVVAMGWDREGRQIESEPVRFTVETSEARLNPAP